MRLRQFMALLTDTAREAWDRRTLQVLAVLALAIVVFCFSISFERSPPEAVLRNQVARLDRIEGSMGLGTFTSTVSLERELLGIRAVQAGDGLGPELEGGYLVELRVPHLHQVDAASNSWAAFDEARRSGAWPAARDRNGARSEEDRRRYFEARFRDFGWSEVVVRSPEDDRHRFLIAVKAEHPHELEGASRMSVFFGAREVELSGTSVAEEIVRLQLMLAHRLVGFIGMLVLISVCAGFIPDLLQKGTVDLVLARPLGRAWLLLAKAGGAVVLIFAFLATVLLLCAVALWVRTGYFNPWLALSAVTATAVFGTIFAVAVLVGVLTRSSNLAALAAFAIWGGASVVGFLHHQADRMLPEHPSLREALRLAYAILPKLPDLVHLNTLFLSRAHLSAEAYERIFAPLLPDLSWGFIAGSTAAFVAVMLALACWVFGRRDW